MADYPVVVYSKPACGYCKLAKELLTKEQVLFREKDLELLKALHPENAQVRDKSVSISHLQAYINGLMYKTRSQTVPQIFICGEYVGGK